MQPFGYTGYQMETAGGLYFAQARQYDAENGRFVSEDKISGFTSAPFTLNRYNYCWNQPINYIDRNGERPEWIDTSEEGAREKIEENKENIIRAAEEAGVDTSVGIGQVRISTAKEIEEMGYMPLTSNTEGGWNLPFSGFVHGTEQMAREQRLED